MTFNTKTKQKQFFGGKLECRTGKCFTLHLYCTSLNGQVVLKTYVASCILDGACNIYMCLFLLVRAKYFMHLKKGFKVFFFFFYRITEDSCSVDDKLATLQVPLNAKFLTRKKVCCPLVCNSWFSASVLFTLLHTVRQCQFLLNAKFLFRKVQCCPLELCMPENYSSMGLDKVYLMSAFFNHSTLSSSNPPLKIPPPLDP